ncbi:MULTISPECIES: PTS mannitol transporter subunit IICBA [unclassified Luteococcus]|uniref:PTS mannitol transporter subunit IICBA n=1 Tax=unclassified Luteococcus TaxID=2639923 RepID=UPI00313D2A32
MSTPAAPSAAKQAQAHVQRFGTFLSGMIMPNIGALIAWGLITALFIEVGWLPILFRNIGSGVVPDWVGAIGGWGTHMVDGKEVKWDGLVGPSISYLLPLLIGYMGGRMVYDDKVRGGVLGAIATMGVIVGVPSSPMFLGAMIMGPLGGWTMKKLDALWEGKIRPGFEMLVNNFSAGIWGMIVAIFGFFAVSPVVHKVIELLGKGVDALVSHNALPVASVIIEPAKVLFLNNAINHGVLTPLGTEQVSQAGKSILLMLESNPGPGLGILLAYMLFGKGMSKASAPGAAIIHFLGGIHEIYFPYILMKPALLLATIAGGASGVAINQLFKTGLVGPAAPGSIFAYMMMAAPGDLVKILLAILVSAAVTFAVAMPILKMDKSDGDLSKATADMEAMKGKKSSVAGNLVAAPKGEIKNIVFACDAGMGSSAMGASVLRNKVKEAGFGDVKVTNEAIANLKDVYDIVVTQETLAPRAIPKVPSATVLTVDNFMNSPRYDEVVEMIRTQRSGSAAPAAPVAATAPVAAAAPARAAVEEDAPANGVLATESIQLGAHAVDKGDAITQAGRLLVNRGAVGEAYIDAMHQREQSVSTYMGNFLAIPHGTNEAKEHIFSSAMSFIRLAEPIDWNGNQVKFVVGIAGKNKEHLQILGKLAKIFSNNESVAALEQANSADEVAAILGKVNS